MKIDLKTIIKAVKDNPSVLDLIQKPLEDAADDIVDAITDEIKKIGDEICDGIKAFVDGILEEIKKE